MPAMARAARGLAEFRGLGVQGLRVQDPMASGLYKTRNTHAHKCTRAHAGTRQITLRITSTLETNSPKPPSIDLEPPRSRV